MPKRRYCAKSVFDTPYSQGVEASGPGTTLSTLITTPALAHPDCLIEIGAVAFVEGR
jgi:hypothetical protein